MSADTTPSSAPAELPMADRPIDDLPGHWVLARLGKRVLRPGGSRLTEWLVRSARTEGQDVVELAPGLGKTARLLLATGPRSYRGVDDDPAAAQTTARVVGAAGDVTRAPAAETGLDSGSADVVLAEAMLTMQGAKGKDAIVAEAHRVLRPGGRYAIHELCLEPDTLSDEQKTEIRRALATSIKVNARPLTTAEWSALLAEHGFTVESVEHAPMALLELRRNLVDEGPLGVARIAVNLLRNPGARKRVLGMRKVFVAHRDDLAAIGIIAVRNADAAAGSGSAAKGAGPR